MNSFQGYPRPDGTFGVRNHVAVIPSVICANVAAERIAAQVPGAVALSHASGCAHVDAQQVTKALIGMGNHPNVAAVLVVGLGCEQIQAPALAEAISLSRKPTEVLVIQKEGGVPRTVAKGTVLAKQLAQHASSARREDCSLSQLVLATECGGSDATSGIAANPVIGVVSDWIVAAGGTVILSETTEIVGAEHILARWAASSEAGQQILDLVGELERDVARLGCNICAGQPSPGNIAGGLTTIEEKSLGCICKAGHAPVQGVLRYAEKPPAPGLYFMDTPGQDSYSVTGMVAGGAQIVIFSTGSGTPLGNPLAPVIKITGNRETASRMADHIDFSAVPVVDGLASTEELGEALLGLVLAVANGQLAAAERLGHRELSIYASPQVVL
ncbi:MAG: altronate dehydratase [Chloroflexi bacterium]|nr:altronate dehydratase [Chloroflexota bacterium]